ADFEHLWLEPPALALVARHEDIGEKLHFDPDFAFALAGLAASARDIEREMARGQAAGTRILGGGKQLANRIEGLQIRHGIAAGRAADRRLIDEHRVGDELHALELRE